MISYITVAGAQDFFDTFVLDDDAWECATPEQQQKSLNQGTKIIDRLNYAGCKTDPNQENQFPRSDDTVTPTDIQEACCWIALKLLDGVDPEFEFDNLSVRSQSFGGASTSFDRTTPEEHVIAGVPSITAWRLMKPYLRDPRVININRT